jgi:hypothetical protein
MPPRYFGGNGLEYLGNRAKGRHQGSLRSKFKRASYDESSPRPAASFSQKPFGSNRTKRMDLCVAFQCCHVSLT